MNRTMIILFLLLFVISGMKSQSITVPESIQAKIFLKVLTFERNLIDKDDDVVVNILYQENYKESFSAYKKISDEIINNYKNVFSNRKIIINGINLDKTNEWAKSIDKKKINIIYVLPLRAFKISDISEECRKSKMLSFTAVPEYVVKGISIGIDLFNSKPKILINLKASKLEGAKLSSQILRISRLID